MATSQFFTFQSLMRTAYDFFGLLGQAWVSAFSSPQPARIETPEEIKDPIPAEPLP
jgi:hypothetical protein